jgi:hypothetical protein
MIPPSFSKRLETNGFKEKSNSVESFDSLANENAFTFGQ